LLANAFHEFNFVTVRDQGSGMTTNELKSCYLTIGTPVRLHERQKALSGPRSQKGHIPLGEKGIGRLAAMRIGHHVVVKTGVRGETVWNQLTLDWRPLFADPDLNASALRFSPKATNDAKSARATGTAIVIRDLQSDWSEQKVEDLGKTEFAKLRDPFRGDYANQFLRVTWQGQSRQDILKFTSSMLKHADAKCTISFRTGTGDTADRDRGPRLTVSTSYRTFQRAETVVHEGAHLNTCVSYEPRGKKRPKAQDKLAGSDEVIDALATLGDFDAEFHWFNRGRFMRDESALWEAGGLKKFVRAWSGGLLVYRDGYRVYPYGSPEDDWLDLDRKALSAGAYKLNRAQIVGYLRISSAENPRLQDQTNREGFRDCPEREALKRLLRQAIVSDCKTFLETVDRSSKPADEETINTISKRIDKNQRSAAISLRQLRNRVPTESETVDKVIAQLKEVEEAWDRAKEALLAHDEEVEKYVHLAGVGLMVELIAHELSRATQSLLEILGKKNLANNPGQLIALEAQIKTLSKRIRILDELSIPGRQIRAIHDLEDLANLAADLYETKAKRHGVDLQVKPLGKGKLKYKVERGQILQILDNLLNNAFYWLARRLNRSQKSRILIEVDADDREIRVIDNGPGIPVSTGQKVFEAFYTTKPAGEGRGLGLQIARRLAEENSAKLDLLDDDGHDHHGFVLRFGD
jgi:signal transduction histidine kinase